MSFTTSLWEEITPIYKKILDLPFNKELTEGTLPEDTFAFYMKQDALYLADFSKALAIAGAKSQSADELKDFLDFATGAVVVERALHESFLQKFDTHIDVDKSPTCFAYTHFLLSTASLEDYPVAVAALLPCFWIYREVGLHIHQKSAKNNPYREWIITYAGEDFSESVDRAIEITELAAQKSSDAVRGRMRSAFADSTRMEWMFWDSAYRVGQWPV
ncbi:thiaminase II [Rhodohalobacter sp. 8-1]|uniref:thiaminase II n=1 Tax=Rhodohalobacter sp. 8-1 TaxID=3131972 RepID=UPI0030EBE52A